uniref:hypothetical protein n=1 Tax=Vibrio anguillarum TaxID=55601 RepID=UPI00188C52FF
CVRSCRYAVVASVCTDTLDACSSDFISTGVVCSDPDSMVSGGEYPDIPEPPASELTPKFTNTNPDSASVFTAQNLYKLNYFADGVDTVSADLERFKEFLNVTNSNLNNASHTVSSNTRIIDSGFLHIENKLNTTNTKVDGLYSKIQEVKQAVDGIDSGGTGGGGGLTDEQFNSFMGSISGLNRSIYSAADGTNTTLNGIKDVVRPLDWKLDETNRQLYDVNNNIGSGVGVLLEHGLTNTASIVDAIKSSGGTGGGDSSSVVEALNAQTGEIKGSLDALSDALSTGSYVSREFKGKVDFDTVGLYKPDLLESVLADTEELKQQYEQQIDEFKKIFSFDVSQLNSGQYKEHSLDFVLPNGKQLNLKSGVLPAFIDQANLIAAVILFVAAIIAVKAILGSRK